MRAGTLGRVTTRARTPALLLLLGALLLAACSQASSSAGPPGTPLPGTTPTSATGPLDVYGDFQSATYGDDANWLCLPGRADDPCAANLDATVVEADGTATVEPGPVADPDAPIDCFYVYPTVSTDPTPNSDMIPGAAEQLSARYQVARYRDVCRVFAPVYRQNTLASLSGAAGTEPPYAERSAIATGDVVEAWKDYIAHRNGGRPFVLVGHSQGSQIVRSLLTDEILGNSALRSKLVSAIVPGMPGGLSSVAADGQPDPLPACTAAGQTGCVVVYSAFRADSPPLPDAIFGPALDGHAICTNPGAWGGGEGPLKAYLAPSQFGPYAEPGHPDVTTPFVVVPGLIHGECVEGNGSHYLSVSVQPQPGDVRATQLLAQSRPGWGLHVIDVNLALGDLVDLVRSQSAAFRGR